VNALAFLGIAVGLSMLGCLVLWLRSRQPGSMESHIREFAKELDALAPGTPAEKARRRAEQPPERGPGPEQGPGPERPPERGTRPRSG
jgi:hypothetical protein